MVTSSAAKTSQTTQLPSVAIVRPGLALVGLLEHDQRDHEGGRDRQRHVEPRLHPFFTTLLVLRALHPGCVRRRRHTSSRAARRRL